MTHFLDKMGTDPTAIHTEEGRYLPMQNKSAATRAMETELTAVAAESARLKACFRVNMLRLGAGSHAEIDVVIGKAAAPNPDLVTVRREDLRELFDKLLCANWAGNPPQNGIANIDSMIKEMEDAANGT